jgi:hypothetical protein
MRGCIDATPLPAAVVRKQCRHWMASAGDRLDGHEHVAGTLRGAAAKLPELLRR